MDTTTKKFIFSTRLLDDDDKPPTTSYILANNLQAAVLNKLLPLGFKFDTLDSLKRSHDLTKLTLKSKPFLPLKRARRVLL